MMESVFTRLKNAREAKHLTLTDISEATLIDEKFLRAIEEGNTSLLPQTYSRAFIRAYAKVVGLDPHEMMELYDNVPELQPLEERHAPRVEPPIPPPKGLTPDNYSQLKVRMRGGVFAFLILVIVGIVLWNLTRQSPVSHTEEVPFQSVVTENQQRVNPEATTQPMPLEQRPSSTVDDSLSLTATTTDSVWVQIILDGKEEREYLFRPNASIGWKARDQFEVSLGNAGAIEFTLNGHKLGTLGKRGAVVRDVVLSRESITKN